MNKTKDGWYTPLAAQFQGIDEPMPLARFAAIEAVLHLLALNAPATDPPALAYSNGVAGNDMPAVGYATVYPLTMFLRVLTAQLLILIL